MNDTSLATSFTSKQKYVAPDVDLQCPFSAILFVTVCEAKIWVAFPFQLETCLRVTVFMLGLLVSTSVRYFYKVYSKVGNITRCAIIKKQKHCQEENLCICSGMLPPTQQRTNSFFFYILGVFSKCTNIELASSFRSEPLSTRQYHSHIAPSL